MRRFFAGVFFGVILGVALFCYLFLKPISDNDLRKYSWKHGGGSCQPLRDGFSFRENDGFTVENGIVMKGDVAVARVTDWIRRPFIDNGYILLVGIPSHLDLCLYYAK